MTVARSVPDNFCAMAEVMIQTELAAHYGVSVWSVKRWTDTMPQDWQAAFRARSEARRIQAAIANVDKARERSIEAAKIRAANKPPKAEKPTGIVKPMPESVFQDFIDMSIGKVAAKHGVGYDTANRWRNLMTPEQQAAIGQAMKARQKALSTASLKLAVQRRLELVAAQPPKAARAKKTPGKRSGKNWGFNAPAGAPPVPAGHAAMAAQHLRRFYAPVVRGDVLNKSLTGYYKVGREIMPEAAVLELARKKGWQPDAWRQVVAS